MTASGLSLSRIDQPGIGSNLAPRSPISLSAIARLPTAPAPELRVHTADVLAELLGRDGGDIEALRVDGAL